MIYCTQLGGCGGQATAMASPIGEFRLALADMPRLIDSLHRRVWLYNGGVPYLKWGVRTLHLTAANCTAVAQFLHVQ